MSEKQKSYMMSGISVVLFVFIVSLFVFTGSHIRGRDAETTYEDLTNDVDIYRGMVSDLDYIKSLEQKIIKAETRQQQESALRCVFWLVFDNPERLSMQISVTDNNGLEKVDDINSADFPLNVTVCLTEKNIMIDKNNWDYSFQFTPKHLDNVYILLGNEE